MKIETLVPVDQHLFAVEPDGQQTLADIQNQLADQLNALKSTLLEQAARLPNFENENANDQRSSSVEVVNSGGEAGGLHDLKDALEAALTDVEDARSGL